MLKIISKITFFVLFALPMTTTSCAKEGYNIEIQVHGISDTLSYLAYHYGDRQYLRDTVEVDSEGRFAFKGKEKLPGGMYLIVVPGQKFFEIIVDRNQNFAIETVMDDFVESMKITGSPENNAFYEYLRFLRQMSEKVAPIREELHDISIPDERRDSLQNQSRRIDDMVQNKQEEYMDKFPDGVFTSILKAQKSVPRPQPNVKEDGTIDHIASYQQYKKDFWQNVDFSDNRLLRTPAYHAKLREYFEHVIIQHPDTIIKEADKIINKTIENEDMFRYTLSYLTSTSERSNIMGVDAVFVHLVNEYYKTGKAFWMEEERLARIVRRSGQLEPILLGKIAPDIKMYLPDKSTLSLREVDAKFIVLYFWDSECSHCKSKTPKINEFYNKFKDGGVKIFAVNTEIDREKWLNYIEKNNIEEWINVNDPANLSEFRDKYDIYSIPLVFLLDEDKRILAKRLNAEQLDDFISRKLRER